MIAPVTTPLDEAHGWLVGIPGMQIRPIARSLTPMKPISAFIHTNGNGVGTSTPDSMFRSIMSQITAGKNSVIIPTVQVGFTEAAQFKSIYVMPSTQSHANAFSIGIECADSGAQNNPYGGIDKEPFNAFQLETIAQILAACNRLCNLSLGRSSFWNQPGAEGHCASNLIPGDKRGFTYPNVTTSEGKICPGHARLAQIPGIIARAIEIRRGQTPITNPAHTVQTPPTVPAPHPILSVKNDPLPVGDDEMQNYILSCTDTNARPGEYLVTSSSIKPFATAAEVLYLQAVEGPMPVKTLDVAQFDAVVAVRSR